MWQQPNVALLLMVEALGVAGKKLTVGNMFLDFGGIEI
jgi:hypothetical protein